MSTSPDAKRTLETALKLVEESLPVEAIVLESRENPDVVRADPFAGHGKEVLAMLRDAHAAMVAAGATSGLALRALATVEPFDAHPEIVAVMEEELDHDR
jgi:hypothetical protein